MDKQLIISIGREFGSGGHEIAGILAEKLNLPLYDKNFLEAMAEEKNLDAAGLEKYDERPKNVWITRTVRGYSNSIEENLANMQFEFLKKKAEAGESFIIVGRCAETILKDNPALISIFILGDLESKIQRVCRIYNMTKEEAETFIYRQDTKRKQYHNYYCKCKWGDSRIYDISVNSSKFGEEQTAQMLLTYIEKRIEQR